jgi:predicted amidohydrolase
MLTSLQGNYERILASITISKERGATLRVGPELEIPLAHAFQDSTYPSI